MTYRQFIEKWNTKYLEYNNDSYKNQCMDLFWQYLKEVCGLSTLSYQGWGTANNVWYAARDGKIKGFSAAFELIKNAPNNVPKQGDIVFWGFYPTVTGTAGHVAIYDHGDLYTIVSFDQNYPTGKPCMFVKHGSSKLFHGYRGVLGWWRKK